MAATPEARRRGARPRSPASRWTSATVERAAAALAEDFAPITDMRASAGYRLQGGAKPAAALHLETARRTAATRVLEWRMDERCSRIAARSIAGAACDPPRRHDQRRRPPPLPHDSAARHVAGEAVYVDDIPELPGTLHLSFGHAASARMRASSSLDLSAVRAAPGVVAAC